LVSDPATVVPPPSAATLAQGPRAVLHACRLPVAALLDSCKVQYLCAALPALAAGSHRVLLFSQWTTILDILEELLVHMGIMCVAGLQSNCFVNRCASVRRCQCLWMTGPVR